MSTVRCYLVCGYPHLVQLRDGHLVPGPLAGYVVTADTRLADPDGDEESWEYAALQEAAAAQLTRGEPVVVLAADLPEGEVRITDRVAPGGPPADVHELALPRVAALHLGDDVVTGDPSARPATDEEIELSWYDTTELDHVIDLVAALPDGAAPAPHPTPKD